MVLTGKLGLKGGEVFCCTWVSAASSDELRVSVMTADEIEGDEFVNVRPSGSRMATSCD